MSTTQTTDMTWIKDIDNISGIIGKRQGMLYENFSKKAYSVPQTT